MHDFIPAMIVAVVGTPLSFMFYRWYVNRWHRKHGRTEEMDQMIAKALEHNRNVDKHGGTYMSVVLNGRRY
jgi:hypothetical protein